MKCTLNSNEQFRVWATDSVNDLSHFEIDVINKLQNSKKKNVDTLGRVDLCCINFTQQGRWQLREEHDQERVFYNINIGGSTEDTITVTLWMPLCFWVPDEDSKPVNLCYVASGNHEGKLKVTQLGDTGLTFEPPARAVQIIL